MEALQPGHGLGRNPLFQVMFNHQAYSRSADQGVQLPGLSLGGWVARSAPRGLRPALDVHEGEDGIWASFGYATDLFEASTVERLARRWQKISSRHRGRTGRPVAELPRCWTRHAIAWCGAWAENADEGGLPPLVQLQIQGLGPSCVRRRKRWRWRRGAGYAERQRTR
ncbi:hypothetical protein P4220_00025 [Pseudomonas aeruginosa]|nr:hypothetical protein [Pseudomonas aeruginosa]